jgi:predicted transcriptional regulator with HTH domain
VPPLNKSNEKRIKEQILQYLYEKYPSSFTSKWISKELIRDNEFVGRLLNELEVAKVIEKNERRSSHFTYYRLSEIAKKAYDSKV